MILLLDFLAHSQKALSPILVTLFGIVTFLKFNPAKAFSPISDIPSGIIMLVKDRSEQ